MPFQVKFQLAYGGGLPQLPGLAGQVAACTLVFGVGPLAFARVLEELAGLPTSASKQRAGVTTQKFWTRENKLSANLDFMWTTTAAAAATAATTTLLPLLLPLPLQPLLVLLLLLLLLQLLCHRYCYCCCRLLLLLLSLLLLG